MKKMLFADSKDLAVPSCFPVIGIVVGESGYNEIISGPNAKAAPMNASLDNPPSAEVVMSAIAGSMFGWNFPAAKAAVDWAAE